MATTLGDNISYGGQKPNFERDQFASLAAAKAFGSALLDVGHTSYMVEEGKHYVWNGTEWVDKYEYSKAIQATEGSMGYIVLSRDKTFAEQVTKANTIYEIRHEYILSKESQVTLPSEANYTMTQSLTFAGGTSTRDVNYCVGASTIHFSKGKEIVLNRGVLMTADKTRVIQTPYTPDSDLDLYIAGVFEDLNEDYVCKYTIRDIIGIPANSVLKFEGGKLTGGVLEGEFAIQNTSNEPIFGGHFDWDITTLRNSLPYSNLAWFGADNSGERDASAMLLAFVGSVRKNNSILEFAKGTYLHGDGVVSDYSTGKPYYMTSSSDGKYRPSVQYGDTDENGNVNAIPASYMQAIGRKITLWFEEFDGLLIKGNGATIKSHEGNADTFHNSIMYLRNCNNMTIEDLVLDGNKNARKPVMTDYSVANIAVRNNISVNIAHNLRLFNVVSNNSTMDGLYLEDQVEDCIVSHCVFNNNYRQGITVGNKTKGLVITNVECSYTGQDYGTLPMAGIDIEANAEANTQEIPDSAGTIIRNSRFIGNVGSAVDMAIGARDNVVDSCIVLGNGGIGGNTQSGKSYNNTIKNCYFEDTAIFLNIPGFVFINNVCRFSADFSAKKEVILKSNLANFNYDEAIDVLQSFRPIIIKNNVFYVQMTDQGNYGKLSIEGHSAQNNDCIIDGNIFTNTDASNSVPSIGLKNINSLLICNNTFKAEKGTYGTIGIENVKGYTEYNNYLSNYLSQSYKSAFAHSLHISYTSAPASMPSNSAIGAWVVDQSNSKKPNIKIWNGEKWVTPLGEPIYSKLGNVPSLSADDTGLYYVAADHEYQALFWTGYSWRRADGTPITTPKSGTIRPNPSTDNVPIGYCFYDTTTKKPIWWDGENWYNANGEISN